MTRFFRAEQTALDILQSECEASSQVLEAYIEEHAVEDGLLADAMTDSGKVSKASVAARLKLATEIDEITALKQVKKLIETEAEHKKAVKDAQEKLDLLVFQQYPKLSIDDIKALIVEDKWLSTLQASIVAEIERVTQQLANRVKTLEERYAEPLSTIEDSVSALSEKVYAHLAAMGLQRNGELKSEE